jgi:hypothetical protein
VLFRSLGLVALGGALWLVGHWGVPLGRLPGDIHFEGKGFSFYFPLTTSILVSVGLTILLNLLLRLFRR